MYKDFYYKESFAEVYTPITPVCELKTIYRPVHSSITSSITLYDYIMTILDNLCVRIPFEWSADLYITFTCQLGNEAYYSRNVFSSEMFSDYGYALNNYPYNPEEIKENDDIFKFSFMRYFNRLDSTTSTNYNRITALNAPIGSINEITFSFRIYNAQGGLEHSNTFYLSDYDDFDKIGLADKILNSCQIWQEAYVNTVLVPTEISEIVVETTETNLEFNDASSDFYVWLFDECGGNVQLNGVATLIPVCFSDYSDFPEQIRDKIIKECTVTASTNGGDHVEFYSSDICDNMAYSLKFEANNYSAYLYQVDCDVQVPLENAGYIFNPQEISEVNLYLKHNTIPNIFLFYLQEGDKTMIEDKRIDDGDEKPCISSIHYKNTFNNRKVNLEIFYKNELLTASADEIEIGTVHTDALGWVNYNWCYSQICGVCPYEDREQQAMDISSNCHDSEVCVISVPDGPECGINPNDFSVCVYLSDGNCEFDQRMSIKDFYHLLVEKQECSEGFVDLNIYPILDRRYCAGYHEIVGLLDGNGNLDTNYGKWGDGTKVILYTYRDHPSHNPFLFIGDRYDYNEEEHQGHINQDTYFEYDGTITISGQVYYKWRGYLCPTYEWVVTKKQSYEAKHDCDGQQTINYYRFGIPVYQNRPEYFDKKCVTSQFPAIKIAYNNALFWDTNMSLSGEAVTMAATEIDNYYQPHNPTTFIKSAFVFKDSNSCFANTNDVLYNYGHFKGISGSLIEPFDRHGNVFISTELTQRAYRQSTIDEIYNNDLRDKFVIIYAVPGCQVEVNIDIINPNHTLLYTYVPSGFGLKYGLIGDSWHFVEEGDSIYIDACDYIAIKGILRNPQSPDYGTMTHIGIVAGKAMLYGNINTLWSFESPNKGLLDYCGCGLFEGGLITKAPEMPSTRLSEGCYMGMFENTLITETPKLPSKLGYPLSYSSMFGDCKELTVAKEISLEGHAPYGVMENMFAGCESLVSTQKRLYPYVLSQYSYAGMYRHCTHLGEAPEIAAIICENTQSCSDMFYGCTSLYKGPSILNIISNSGYDFQRMFAFCEYLRRSPVLTLTELNDGCYDEMFYECHHLGKIYCKAVNNNDATTNWVYGVGQSADSSDFYLSSRSSWDESDNGVPPGWNQIQIY